MLTIYGKKLHHRYLAGFWKRLWIEQTFFIVIPSDEADQDKIIWNKFFWN